MGNKRSFFSLFLIIIVSIGLIYLVTKNFDSILGDTIEIAIAAIGVGLVLFQLNKEHQITKAEFLYSLNESFSNNKNICFIYNKLKEQRDLGTETVVLTDDDARQMGDYIMFFEIMGYLVNDGIISMKIVDLIFANKFFLFMHNATVRDKQLIYDGINSPILEFYSKWRLYRQKTKQNPLYGDSLVHELKDYFELEKNRLSKKEIIKYKKRPNPIYPSHKVS